MHPDVDLAGRDVLFERLEGTPRVSGTLVHTNTSAATPMTANMKNDPVKPISLTSDGKNSARIPLVVQPKKTEIPIPRPRMCSGKISASHTHTWSP